jgi:hypothetical protein
MNDSDDPTQPSYDIGAPTGAPHDPSADRARALVRRLVVEHVSILVQRATREGYFVSASHDTTSRPGNERYS